MTILSLFLSVLGSRLPDKDQETAIIQEQMIYSRGADSVTMKTGVLAGTLLVLCNSAALACTIEDAQEEGLPGGKRISGQCSNNGSPVTCTFRDGEGWSCDGPGGSYTSLGNPSVPLASACECDTTPKW